MWLTDAEQKELLQDTHDKISRAVTSALRGLGIGKMSADVENVWKIAQQIEARQRKQIEAERHAAATLSSQMPKD